MPDIYEQHAAAFANVSAYVIMRDGSRVATIAFKFPRDGAGRLYAYVHWLGFPMVRGWAGGGGYDKRSAAVASAAKLIKAPDPAFIAAIAKEDGMEWQNSLRSAGFDVLQAV
jgi:hypothetical protein